MGGMEERTHDRCKAACFVMAGRAIDRPSPGLLRTAATCKYEHNCTDRLVFHQLESFFESRTHTSYHDLATTMNLMFDNTEEEDSGDRSDPGPATDRAGYRATPLHGSCPRG